MSIYRILLKVYHLESIKFKIITLYKFIHTEHRVQLRADYDVHREYETSSTFPTNLYVLHPAWHKEIHHQTKALVLNLSIKIKVLCHSSDNITIEN